MKPFLVKFQFFAVFLIVSLQYSCVPLALTGSNNNSTLLGALVAASSISPGLNDVPRDESGQPIIPDNKSYIRIKLQDDPLPPPNDHNLTHKIVVQRWVFYVMSVWTHEKKIKEQKPMRLEMSVGMRKSF